MNGLEEEFKGRLQVVRLDFNAPKNRDAVAALGVRGHPTVVLIRRDGTISRTWLGLATADDLRPLVEAILAP